MENRPPFRALPASFVYVLGAGDQLPFPFQVPAPLCPQNGPLGLKPVLRLF